MRDGQQTTSEDRATQLLICEALSLAKRALCALFSSKLEKLRRCKGEGWGDEKKHKRKKQQWYFAHKYANTFESLPQNLLKWDWWLKLKVLQNSDQWLKSSKQREQNWSFPSASLFLRVCPPHGHSGARMGGILPPFFCWYVKQLIFVTICCQIPNACMCIVYII